MQDSNFGVPFGPAAFGRLRHSRAGVLAIAAAAAGIAWSAASRPADAADVVLGAPRSFDAGRQPAVMALADMNEDGALDVVTATGRVAPENTVGILLADGAGGFSPRVEFGPMGAVHSLATADLDRDGHEDVVVTLETSDRIAIWLGDGLGSLAPGPLVTTVSRPTGVAAADFDEDGWLDLAVGTGVGTTFAVLLADGLGGFGAPVTFGINVGGSVATADFDEDGHVDLVVANPLHQGIPVYLGDGAGGFAFGALPSAFVGTVHVAAEDMNGDGHADIRTASTEATGIRFNFGDGAGGFDLDRPFIEMGGGSTHSSMADFDADGRLDLVTTHGYLTVSIRRGNSLGGFDPRDDYFAGRHPIATVAADFDGDGRLDLGVLNTVGSDFARLLGDGTGAFGTAPGTPVESHYDLPVAADFDADGRLDLAILSSDRREVRIHDGDGRGGFLAPRAFVVDADATADLQRLTVADVDADGAADLVGFERSIPYVLLGDGSGGFAPPLFSPMAARRPTNVIVTDFDEDGLLDLVTASERDDRLVVGWGNGAGIFSDPAEFAIGPLPTRVVTADLDGDGGVEVVCLDSEQSTISVFQRAPGRMLSAPAVFPAPAFPDGPEAADLDEDGFVDLLLFASGEYWACLGDGAGSLGSPISLGPASVFGEIAIADMDEDGHLDVVDSEGSRACVRRGDGALGFGPANWYSTGSLARVSVLDDFDGDGHSDILALDTETQHFVFLRNRTFERCDAPEIPSRAGNVDTGGGSSAVDVVTLNGSAGTPPGREVLVAQGSAATLGVSLPPAGGNGLYALWIFDGEPCLGTPAEAFVKAGGAAQSIGVASFPLPSNNALSPGAAPCPRLFPVGFTSRAIQGAGTAASLCLHRAPAHPRAPAALAVAFPPGTFTVQGLIVDPNSASGPKKVSITNAVVVKVIP